MTTKTDLITWACALPKAELHLHIEGSLEPEMVFTLSKRNHISIPYQSVDELKRAYQFNNLQEFLNVYYAGMSVLITERDFYDLTMAYLLKIKQDNVVHTEIFFDPQGHLCRGIDFATQINGIHRALQDGESQLGISSCLIMSFLRHLSEEDGFATLELAMPHLDKIDGFGLDSSERDHPPKKFERLFAQCRALGKKMTAHAGEEGPSEYVVSALDQLKVDRIDHGNRSLEDPNLIKRLADSKITLTVCPLSNHKLCVVKDLTQHPLKEMLENGLNVTINSDDPSYFGGYLNDNYIAMIEHLDISAADVYQLAVNSIHSAWLDPLSKKTYLNAIEKSYQTFLNQE